MKLLLQLEHDGSILILLHFQLLQLHNQFILTSVIKFLMNIGGSCLSFLMLRRTGTSIWLPLLIFDVELAFVCFYVVLKDIFHGVLSTVWRLGLWIGSQRPKMVPVLRRWIDGVHSLVLLLLA